VPDEALDSGPYFIDVYGAAGAVVEASAKDHVHVAGYLRGGDPVRAEVGRARGTESSTRSRRYLRVKGRLVYLLDDLGGLLGEVPQEALQDGPGDVLFELGFVHGWAARAETSQD